MFIPDADNFGNEENPEPLDSNPFRYCGEYFDKETGEIYLRARYYDPVTGRFGTEDPARSGLNWYTYCGNNPIAFYDPTGCIAYSQSWQGGYLYYVSSREQSGIFLGFGAIPHIGTIIDLTHSASNWLSGMKEIGKPKFNEFADFALSSNSLLQTADEFDMTRVVKNNKWLGEFSKVFGKIESMSFAVDTSELLFSQQLKQTDIIDQIIARQFSTEMFSSTREMMEYKYLFANHAIKQLIKGQKLTYTEKKSGDLLKLNMSSTDQKSIAKMLSSLGRLSDAQIKKRLSRLGIV